MALEKQMQAVAFTQGVDTKTDGRLSSKPSRLENMVFRGGTLGKRYGTTAFNNFSPSGSIFGSGEAFFPFDDELVRIEAGLGYGYSPALRAWMGKGGGGTTSTLTSKRIQRGTTTQWSCDQASVNGVAMLAWAEPTGPQKGVHYIVYDETSGNVIQSSIGPMPVTHASAPRVVVVGNNLVLLFQDTFNGTLYSARLTTGTPASTITAGIIRNDLATVAVATCFDAVAYSSTLAMVVYLTGVTGNAATGLFVDANGAVTTNGGVGPTVITVFTAATTPLCGTLAIQRDTAGRTYVVLYQLSVSAPVARLVMSVFTSTWGVTLAPTNIDTSNPASQISLVEHPNNDIVCVFSAADIAGIEPLAYAVITSTGVGTAYTRIPGTDQVRLVTEAFLFGGNVVFGVVSATQSAGYPIALTQPTMWVMDTTGAPVARALSGLASDNAGTSVASGQTNAYGVQGRLSKAVAVSTSSRLLTYERGRLAFDSALYAQPIDVTPVGLTRLTLTPAKASVLPIIRMGDSTYMGGALPRVYDGRQLVDTGFAVPPLTPIAITVAAGGSLSAGQYQVRYLYSWVDAKGQLVRSPPSPAVTWTAAAGDYAHIQYYPCPLALRDLLPQGISVQLEVYRTTANGTDFFRDSSVSTPIFNVATSVITHDTSQSDSDLQSGELLYTTGGVIDWLAPPSYSCGCAHKERLFIGGLEDPFEVRFSSQVRKGESIRFNEVYSIRVPARTGAVVALASLDDKLIIFTTSAAYAVLGDGPDLLGNNPFLPPQLILSVATGVSSPLVGTIPEGLVVQTTQGIMLLDRALGFQYFGADVETYGTNTIRDITLRPELQQLWILTDTGSDLGAGATCLVWDFFYKQWSVLTSYGGQQACYYQGKYIRVLSSGVSYQEQPGTYTDDGVAYSSVVETSWIKMAGLQGFQRLWRATLLGTYGSNFTLTWDAAYDYSGTYAAGNTITFVGNGVFTAGSPFQIQRHLAQQKCEAIKFRLTDSGISGTGQGMALTGLELEFGIKRGTFKKLPNAQTT